MCADNSQVLVSLHIDNYQKALAVRKPHQNQAIFPLGMIWVIHSESKRVTEGRHGLLKGDAMLAEIALGFIGVPLKVALAFVGICHS